MQNGKRTCPKCSEIMNYVLCTPTFVCTFCGRMETESGFVINAGRDLHDNKTTGSCSDIAGGR